jgi:uncharacterized repeat protein (TIGR02543 family)
LPTTTRTGYTLKGWYTAASGGTKISSTTKITKAITFYAQWTAVEVASVRSTKGPFIWPLTVKGYVSCPYAENVIHTFHTGVDISDAGIKGKPVLAAADGLIVSADVGYTVESQEKDGSGYGNHIVIKHNLDGETYYTWYCHMKDWSFTENDVGKSVSAGQKIGTVGSTGWSYGPHLHFEIRIGKNATSKTVNPMDYFS